MAILVSFFHVIIHLSLYLIIYLYLSPSLSPKLFRPSQFDNTKRSPACIKSFFTFNNPHYGFDRYYNIDVDRVRLFASISLYTQPPLDCHPTHPSPCNTYNNWLILCQLCWHKIDCSVINKSWQPSSSMGPRASCLHNRSFTLGRVCVTNNNGFQLSCTWEPLHDK